MRSRLYLSICASLGVAAMLFVQLPSSARMLSASRGSTLLPMLQQRAKVKPKRFRIVSLGLQGEKKLIKKRYKMEDELAKIAILDRSVMIPMRDGKKMLADIYIPKKRPPGGVPVILSRTPYNFNYWDVGLGAPANMSREIEAVKHGYAYAIVQERGHTFSQGTYQILGVPRTDGYDEIKWLDSRPWSNGKLAPTGCSSTAEWQSAVVALGPPGLATFNPRDFGAGIGRVGPYYVQGDFYQGGAFRMNLVDWIYHEQNTLKPMFPSNYAQQQLTEARKMFNLEPRMTPIDWAKADWHLPVSRIIQSLGGPRGIFATPQPTLGGGNIAARLPNSPAWYKGGLWDEGEKINVPGLWFMSWFDFTVGPNLAEYHYVQRTAPAKVGKEQYLIIAPNLHCRFIAASNPKTDFKVGQLDVGDAKYPYKQYMYAWFDHFLKGEHNGVLKQHAPVIYYLMGKNEWKDSPTWPPPGAVKKTFYLAGKGRANTLYGDGELLLAPTSTSKPDEYVYNPANPVPTLGGGGCCLRGAKLGSFDQDRLDASRNDILVYTTPPFKKGMEVSGPITVTLYVSSSAKDTDFTFKVLNVFPDGKAYNITQNAQRARWRDGYDHKPVWMQRGHVYKITFQPVDISDYFFPGHKLRITVSSSNFPFYDRNLNTGLNNQTTSKMVIAHNAIHHDAQYPSRITLTVLPGDKARPTDPYSLAQEKLMSRGRATGGVSRNARKSYARDAHHSSSHIAKD